MCDAVFIQSFQDHSSETDPIFQKCGWHVVQAENIGLVSRPLIVMIRKSKSTLYSYREPFAIVHIGQFHPSGIS
jgi:hypothetical protein